ncbi:MAG: selenocysteine-specific translation elongation factor [Candidatus Riflebacteria bacterium]|nr:selenocysteine-specific translation elongation factor [Candidatus Riflebacteria bacterium]
MTPRPPGYLRADVSPDVIMMACTAGHVDHGKTQLVKLLTGCETDLLEAEKERGLTIELGFAPCYLGDGQAVGIVDVPGHEKFVRTMVSGVSGIDTTILVVAADDGVMPQTVEHLQIMQLLGLAHGIVALTKVDLVSEQTRAERIDQIRALLGGTFLERAPICPVSSKTFQGYGEFYETLVGRVRSLSRPVRPGVFRLPVDRVFSVRGFGTVISGIPVAGTVQVGDRVEAVPGGAQGTVRSIQCFLRDAPRGQSGQCLALNIPDFGRESLRRGQVVGPPGYLREFRVFHVRLETLSSSRTPLRNADPIMFHTGTTEESGKVYLLEAGTLEPGQSQLATVVMEGPVVAAAMDRFILRRPSPAATIGGGEILAGCEGQRRPRRAAALSQLRAHESFFEGRRLAGETGVAWRIEHFLKLERPTGAPAEEISRALLLGLDQVELHLAQMARDGTVLTMASHQVHVEAYRECLAAIEARVRRAAAEGGQLVLSLSELRRDCPWPAELWNRIQRDLEASGLVSIQGHEVTLVSGLASLSQTERRVLEELLRVYRETGYQSPRPDELPDRLGAPSSQIERLLEALCTQGRLVRLGKNVILSLEHCRAAQDLVVRLITEKGKLDSADFKHDLGSTRKYSLAILDYLDSRQVTIRHGNERRLSSDYAKRLL